MITEQELEKRNGWFRKIDLRIECSACGHKFMPQYDPIERDIFSGKNCISYLHTEEIDGETVLNNYTLCKKNGCDKLFPKLENLTG